MMAWIHRDGYGVEMFGSCAPMRFQRRDLIEGRIGSGRKRAAWSFCWCIISRLAADFQVEEVSSVLGLIIVWKNRQKMANCGAIL